MKQLKSLLFTCFFTLLTLLFCIHAYASDSGAIYMSAIGEEVKNGYFVIEKNAGESGSITVNLRNISNKLNAETTVFISDAVVAVGGGLGIVTPETAIRKDIGSWFSFKEQTVSMKPGESRDMTFNFTIPDNAKPGSHVGQIAIYKYMPSTEIPKKLNKNEAQVIINKAYVQAIGIEIQITGPTLHKLELVKFEPHWTGKELFLNLSIANEGNAIEKSNGTITITSRGVKLYTHKAEMGSIYAGTTGIYTFPATETLKKRGKYTAQVDWNYGDKHVKKTFEYSIDWEDVNQAEKIDLASQGIKVPTNAIIIKPVHLIGGTAVILILGVIIFILLLRNKKKCKK